MLSFRLGPRVTLRDESLSCTENLILLGNDGAYRALTKYYVPKHCRHVQPYWLTGLWGRHPPFQVSPWALWKPGTGSGKDGGTFGFLLELCSQEKG